eukprot:Gb_37316 [translate_table: standard]
MEKYGKSLLSIILCACIFSSADGLKADLPDPVAGLSWTFYNESCPNLESIVNATLDSILAQDITQAAGLLRLHFHDCFVQGCDASVLLEGSTSGPDEQDDTPNLTLRRRAFQIINQIKAAVEANCGGVVTCADIVALAARDSIVKAGGPEYPVPLGRRDSLTFANQSVTNSNLPPPTANISALVSIFGPKGFTLTDLVALSGGHTIGLGHCSSFGNRLYNISTGAQQQDSTLSQSFANNLYSICPAVNNTVNSTDLDIGSPNVFDNQYFVNIQNGNVLFTSDATLYTNTTTQNIVDCFASNQTLFFEKFVLGMLKMGQLNVLTGSQGEIRSNCSTPNPSSSGEIIESIVDEEESLSEL